MKDKVLDLVYWNSPHEERITVAFPFLKKKKRKRKIPFNDFDLILSWSCEPLAWSSGWKKILMVYHGLFSICIIPSGEKDCVPLCKLSVIVRHGADILLSIVVAFDSLVFLGPRVSSENECDRLSLRAPSVSTCSTVQQFRLAPRPLGSIRSLSCVFSYPIICRRAFL